MKLTSFKIVTAALILAIILVGWVAIFGDKGWLAYRHLVQTKVEMQEKITALETENHQMAHEVYRLKHDRDYLERVVRQQLDMGKPDELVFKFKSHR
jgi:cell division protein FtsB